MRNMDRFADVLEGLLRDGVADRLWVTMFNEPNTTQRTLPEYEQVYRLLDRQLRDARGARSDPVHGGRPHQVDEPERRRPSGSSTWRANMGDLLDAWSVHVYWDFWETDKIDERLLREVRTIFSAIPAGQRRPLYVTEFGVRGLGTFEGETELRTRLLARRHTDVRDQHRRRSSKPGSTSARRSSATRGQ